MFSVPSVPSIDGIFKNRNFVNASHVQLKPNSRSNTNVDMVNNDHMYYNNNDQISFDQSGYIPMPSDMESKRSDTYGRNTMIAIMILSGVFVASSIYYLKGKKSNSTITKFLPSIISNKDNDGCLLCNNNDNPNLNLCKKHQQHTDESKILLLKNVEAEIIKTPKTPSTYKLTKLELYPQFSLKLKNALEVQNVGCGMLNTDKMVNSIIINRPLIESNEGPLSNMFGVFEITPNSSAVLNIIESNGDIYNEIVVYSYPDWNVVYANTKIEEVYFDSLKPGKYMTMIFSTEKINAVFTYPTQNIGKPFPMSRPHRKTSAVVNDNREAANESVIMATDGNISEDFNIKSSSVFIWPGTVYTRVENINVNIPNNINKLYVTVPSFGFITDGYEEHIGKNNKIHEGDNTSIYKVIKNSDNIVNITVVYPNIDPESEVIISPSFTLYGFED